MNLRQLVTPAVSMGISVSIATGLYGFSFGALSMASDLTVWQSIVLSALMFTGGSQFAFVGVISGAGGVGHLASPADTGALALSAASILGVRNAVYGMQNNVRLRAHGVRKIFAAQLSIDESTAVASAQEDEDEIRRGFWVTGIGVWILWNIFTILGALIGTAMGDPAVWGLDGAAAAAFCALLWSRLKNSHALVLTLLCGFIAVISTPVLTSGLPILAAACAAGVWGWVSAHQSYSSIHKASSKKGTKRTEYVKHSRKAGDS